MQKVIGRESEIEKLQQALNTEKPELIALYGRRRVGKTFLVRQVYKKHIQFELTGLHHGQLADQLKNFHLKLSAYGVEAKVPKSWLDAFDQLEQYLDSLTTKKKKVVFIDEFPWLATRKSKFLMAFERFWNGYASGKNDLIVVICGSAASYMVKNIIRNKGGLHNRITRKIRLLPFNLFEVKQFLKSKKISYTHYDVLRIYMAIGGIPHYLEKLQTGESVPQAIDRLCFHQDADLRTEFKDLFASLFEHAERHDKVIRALATTRKGLTRDEISKKSGIITGGRLTVTLDELEESGFIESSFAFQKVKKNAIYRVNDEYIMFYLKFIEHHTSTGKGTWLTKSGSQSYKSWSGYSFEMVCLKHVEQIKSSLGISAIHSENFSWAEKNQDKGAQIDLLIDRADNVINLCEMKFHEGKFTITKRYAEEIRNKVETFRSSTGTTKNIFVTILTVHGLKHNQHSTELIQNELTIDCLFKF